MATLEQVGLAMSMAYLDPSAIRQWLDMEPAGAVAMPDVASALASWVLSGDWHHCDELWQQLWQQVEFPDLTRDLMVDFYPEGGIVKRSFSITGSY